MWLFVFFYLHVFSILLPSCVQSLLLPLHLPSLSSPYLCTLNFCNESRTWQFKPVGLVQLRTNEEIQVLDFVVLAYEGCGEAKLTVSSYRRHHTSENSCGNKLYLYNSRWNGCRSHMVLPEKWLNQWPDGFTSRENVKRDYDESLLTLLCIQVCVEETWNNSTVEKLFSLAGAILPRLKFPGKQYLIYILINLLIYLYID